MLSQKFIEAMKKVRRPMPADFPEKARAMANNSLARHYKSGHTTIARWRRECGAVCSEPAQSTNRQMPADFADHARGLTVRAAARFYHRDTRTIRRWFAYAGITPKAEQFLSTKPVQRAELDSSIPSLAAQHLRRFYASVHRADIRMRDGSRETWGDTKGLPDRGKGQYYVAGLGAIPDYEMVALARDHGFREALD